MKTKYEKGSVRNKNKSSYGKYKKSASSVKTMQKKEHMLRCNQNEQMQKPLYLWPNSCKRLLDAVCPVSIRPWSPFGSINFSFFVADNAPILGNKFSTTWRPQGDYIHLKVVFTVQENALLVCCQRHRRPILINSSDVCIHVRSWTRDFIGFYSFVFLFVFVFYSVCICIVFYFYLYLYFIVFV